MGLLDDLKKQAEIVRTHENVQRSLRLENAEAVETAMLRAFKYLHDLLEQLKVIKPVNPVVYRLPGVGEFRDLLMADSFVGSRTQRVVDKEYLQRIDLFIVWAVKNDLVVERDLPPAAEKMRDQLWRAGIRFDESEQKNALGAVALTRFVIPQSIRMGLSLRADLGERRLVVLARNVLRLGNDEFAVPADECTEPVLESLAQMLIGQTSTFRSYRTVLATDSWLTRE